MILALKLWLNLTFARLLAKSTTLIALIVIIVAVSIRVIVVLPEVKVEGTGDDALRYAPIARNLVAGNGFSAVSQPPYVPDDFEQPGYPFFVAAIYWFTSVSSKAVVVVQILLELATLLLVVKISRSLGLSYRVQMFALAIGLICPFLPIYSARILTEVLATFIITLTCYLLIKASTRQNPRGWIYAGLSGGFSLLIRPDLIIAVALLFMVAGFISWRHYRVRGVYGILICTFVCSIVLTPWTVRNYWCFSEIRPLGRASEQAHSGYAKWLSTWSVGYTYHMQYWWFVLKPGSQYGFPLNIFPDDEKEKAEQALQLAREQGTFDGQPSKEFAALAYEARQKRPLNTYFIVPVLRFFYTWVMMPIHMYMSPFRVLHSFFLLSKVVYLCWILFLVCGIVGIVISVRQKKLTMCIPGAVILGRSILPILSVLAIEPRYMIEALPICFIFAAIPLSAIRRKKKNYSKSFDN